MSNTLVLGLSESRAAMMAPDEPAPTTMWFPMVCAAQPSQPNFSTVPTKTDACLFPAGLNPLSHPQRLSALTDEAVLARTWLEAASSLIQVLGSRSRA